MTLHTKYRPQHFEEVIGQAEAVRSLQDLIETKKAPKAFLFTGPSGTGKTTLARIIANKLGCDVQNIIEIDAATNTGVDDMRTLCEGLRYPAFGKTSIKVAIIDEAHFLSKSSWGSLLKIIEEPPNHLYFIFCTTEPSKIIDTIKTRCHQYNLKEVSTDDLMDLLEFVAESEQITLPDTAIGLVARSAQGSPRMALVRLSQIRNCKTVSEIKILLEQPLEESEVIDLCRLIVSGRGLTWKKIIETVNKLKEQNPESIRIQIVNYLTACILRNQSEKEAIRLLTILDYFSKPIYQSTGFSDLLLSFGQVVFSDQ